MGTTTEGALDPLSERGMETVRRGRQATSELNAYIAEQVKDRRRNPSDDLIGTMVAAPFAQTGMSEVEIIASSEAPGGVGEPGTPPIAPAVANAVFALTGRRLRELPMRLDLVAI